MEQEFYFDKILDIIQQKTGLDCRQYTATYIRRRIETRMLARDFAPDGYGAYLRVLLSEPGEIRGLCDALTVNVTRFFRDPNLWSFLKSNVLPKILREKKERGQRELLIWSCGCSSGEKPYSLAMVLRDLLPAAGFSARIIATDIDPESLRNATAGVYNESALLDAPPEYRHRYLIPQASGRSARYAVSPAVKALVRFQEHNFLSSLPPARNFDMIFCRNVIIYFTMQCKEKVLDSFWHALVDQGWLVLGGSEVLFTAKWKNKFYLYTQNERIFRKERRKALHDPKGERRKNWWAGYSGQ